MFRYILFDFDGTVFDTVVGITRSVQYAAARFGFDVPAESLRCFAGPPLADMFTEHFGMSPEDAEQAVIYFRERYLPVGLYECSVFPGIKDLLSDLRDAGYKTGIATSKPQELAEKLLSDENMLGLFDVICGSSPAHNNDTKASVLSRALSLLGADAAETVLIGDTKYDVYGAGECGVACIGVEYGYAAEGELEKAGADIIVPNIPSLRKIFLT